MNRKKCPRGYKMIRGVCKEINSISRRKRPINNNGDSNQTREQNQCCYDLSARYECRFACTPCLYWNGFMYVAAPGTDCFEITQIISDCPSGANPQQTANACLQKLQAYSHVYGTCPEQMVEGIDTVSGNCTCMPFINGNCPGQGGGFGDNPFVSPPKSEF